MNEEFKRIICLYYSELNFQNYDILAIINMFPHHYKDFKLGWEAKDIYSTKEAYLDWNWFKKGYYLKLEHKDYCVICGKLCKSEVTFFKKKPLCDQCFKDLSVVILERYKR